MAGPMVIGRPTVADASYGVDGSQQYTLVVRVGAQPIEG